jgi:hypothetical protein
MENDSRLDCPKRRSLRIESRLEAASFWPHTKSKRKSIDVTL